MFALSGEKISAIDMLVGITLGYIYGETSSLYNTSRDDWRIGNYVGLKYDLQ
jgi:hypothetical protein